MNTHQLIKPHANAPACLFSQERFVQLYETQFPHLYRYALRLTGVKESAEDVVQEVFSKVWMIRHQLLEVRDLSSYLMTVTYNLSIDIIRKNSLKQKLALQDIFSQEQVRCLTEEMVDAMELQKVLQEAIAALSPQRKKVFVLGKLEGWKRERIAAHLGISACTVKATMQIALREVHLFLERKTGLKKRVFVRERSEACFRSWLEAA